MEDRRKTHGPLPTLAIQQQQTADEQWGLIQQMIYKGLQKTYPPNTIKTGQTKPQDKKTEHSQWGTTEERETLQQQIRTRTKTQAHIEKIDKIQLQQKPKPTLIKILHAWQQATWETNTQQIEHDKQIRIKRIKTIRDAHRRRTNLIRQKMALRGQISGTLRKWHNRKIIHDAQTLQKAGKMQ